jgi:cephalosporin hydroxylase
MIKVDLPAGLIQVDDAEPIPLGTAEGFAIVSRIWLRSGWDAKYVYGFTWMGRPVIQLPDDLLRIQEVVWSVRPDVIIETGVAHGGSLVFYASLCKAMDHGRVIGVDIEVRPHNRTAIEAHPLSPFISLIEGSSTSPEVVAQVSAQLSRTDRVLVLLDSNHSKAHVLAELDAYAPLVTPGSYLVAMDGIMEQVAGAPRTTPDWAWNNPRQAVLEWINRNPDFLLEEPARLFNEGATRGRVTYWPDGFLRRR